MSTAIATAAVAVTDVLFRAISKDQFIPGGRLVVHIGSHRDRGANFCRLAVACRSDIVVPHWAAHASRVDLVRMGRQLEADGIRILGVTPLADHDAVIADIPEVARALADGRPWGLVDLPDNTDALCASCDRRYSFVARAAVMAATREGVVPLCRKCACARHRYAAAARRLYPGAN